MKDERPPCVFCQRVRIFAGLAIVIVALLVAMFAGLFIWKVVQEYWLVDKEDKGEKD